MNPDDVPNSGQVAVQTTRQFLIDAYLDWVNNYLTRERFAEDRGLTPTQAALLIELGRSVFNSKHPEA